ncbi:MAG: DUF2797 domain-containing protein [Halieaceae bacterium]
MKNYLESIVRYEWVTEDGVLSLDDALGKKLTIDFSGTINCIHCGRASKKSFNQGYCYPCFQRLAQCDSCIVKPEKCHFSAGTCREPEWGEAHCNIDHVVYLANTSNVKVGITRGTQVPTRWMDQGATQARPVAIVSTRHLSGLLEITLGQHVGDKTAWQTMLKGDGEAIDLASKQAELRSLCGETIDQLQTEHGLNAIRWLDDADASDAEVTIRYPVLEWPVKVKAHNLDKTPRVEGTLLGIKGQYLMLDTGVLNVRKYGGYHLELKVDS